MVPLPLLRGRQRTSRQASQQQPADKTWVRHIGGLDVALAAEGRTKTAPRAAGVGRRASGVSRSRRSSAPPNRLTQLCITRSSARYTTEHRTAREQASPARGQDGVLSRQCHAGEPRSLGSRAALPRGSMGWV